MHSSVLIVSDDTEFARTLAGRWQSERNVPEITLATSDVWRPASSSGYDLVVVGPVRPGKRLSIFLDLRNAAGTAAVHLAGQDCDVPSLRAEYPQLLVISRKDDWAETLILLANEALRRVEAAARAQRAERLALACERYATLGRYMLEMRPSVNNALTSVLGNADLLLAQPGQMTGETRDQIRTIHTMALRLNEIMQRFSSLASEMEAGEKLSQAETQGDSLRLVAKP
jgi:signal transduction histidine kinase